MQKFNVKIEEILNKVVCVSAGDSRQAIEIVENDYNKEVHVLDYSHLVETNFVIVEDAFIENVQELVKESLIKDVIDFYLETEQKHFEEEEGEDNSHIYLKLKKLQTLINL
ncbi:MAG: hypothetical protein RL728_1138 [Bacteroidota bacterium]|jgi:hypothetical protein